MKKSSISTMLRNTFFRTDEALIKHCIDQGDLDYASSTAVVTLLWSNNMLTVAHVGDSRACIGKVYGDLVKGEFITVDHKPNQPDELTRIQAAGGMLVYLQGNKPFIRGGDFLQRQGEIQHPKQVRMPIITKSFSL